MSSVSVGRLYAVGAALIWGTSWVAIRIALQGFPPFAVAAWRGIGAALFLVPFVLLLERVDGDAALSQTTAGADNSAQSSSARLPRLARLVTLGLLGGLGFVVGQILAVQLSGATVAAFVAGLYPVLAAVAAPLLLPERASRVALVGLAVAFAGVLLLGGFDPTHALPLGLLVGLAAAASFAAFLLLARRWSGPWRLPGSLVTLSNVVILALGAIPLALLLPGETLLPAHPEILPVAALVWLGVGASAIANVFVVGAVRRLPSHESSAYLLLNPLGAAIVAALVLGERLTSPQLLGAAAVLLGIGLATAIDARLRSTARVAAADRARIPLGTGGSS